MTASATAFVVAVPKAVPRLHLSHVEGLRALAAFVVYINHAYAHAWHPLSGYAGGWFSPFAYSLLAGHLAVSVFIVISGFVLTLPVVDAGDELRGGAREFFIRRARRILPPYYAALILSLVLIATIIGEPTGSIWDVPIQADWVAVVSHVLLLQDLFGTGKVNYVFWSIAVEWHIYFCFPLFVLAARRFGMLKVALATLLVGYAMRFGFEGTRIERANPHYVGLFALGMLAAYVVRSPLPGFQRARTWRWGVLSVGALVTTVLLCIFFGYKTPTEHFAYLDLPVGVMALAILIHTSVHQSSLATGLFGWKPIAFIGTFSYSVYLLHAPLLQIVWQYVVNPLHLPASAVFITLMSGGAAVTLLTSYGFFKLCEEPFMRKRRVTQELQRDPVTP